jgi:hypothetical protein
LHLELSLKATDPGALLRRAPLSPLEVLVFARRRCLNCGEPLFERGALDVPLRGCKGGGGRAAHGHRATALHADFERLLGKRLRCPKSSNISLDPRNGPLLVGF